MNARCVIAPLCTFKVALVAVMSCGAEAESVYPPVFWKLMPAKVATPFSSSDVVVP